MSIPRIIGRLSAERPEDTLLRETFESVGELWAEPIIPVLDSDADPDDMVTAVSHWQLNAIVREGLSWWRLGTITPTGWKAINTPVTGTPSPNPPPPA